MNTKWIRAVLAAAAVGLVLAPAARAATSDAWITTKAKMTLLTTDGVPSTAVSVDTVDGRITLHGTVDSAAAKRKAEDAVRPLDGVKGVRNLLQVVPQSRENEVAETDQVLKEHVEHAFADRSNLKDVSVKSVHAGVVLLAGSVSTLSDHLEAMEVAANVPGVKRVASEIKSPDRLADSELYSSGTAAEAPRGAGSIAGKTKDLWITSAVKMGLLADARTPGLDVNVDTTNGTVTLFGIVGSPAAKEAAEEDARKTSGVVAVRNEIEVVPSPKREAVDAKDEVLEERVKENLARQRDLEDVDVDVRNGVARLSGTVPSQEQRLRAAVVARAAAGIRAVQDDLRVTVN